MQRLSWIRHLARKWSACVRWSFLPLLVASVPVQQMPVQEGGVTEHPASGPLASFLKDFSASWCSREDLAPFFDQVRCEAEIGRELRELDPPSPSPVLDLQEALTRYLSPEVSGRRAHVAILGTSPDAESDDAVAFLGIEGENGQRNLLRLSLTRESSSWAIWDLEELRAGIGLVDLETAARLDHLRDPMRLWEFRLWLRQLHRLVADDDLYALPRVLAYRCRHPLLPKRVAAFLRVCDAAIALDQGRARHAVECLELAERFRGGHPLQAQLLAEALLARGNHARALEAVKAWQSFVGVGPESEHLRGRVLERAGDRAGALAVHRAGLERRGGHLGCLASFVRLLPADGLEVIERNLRAREDPYWAYLVVEHELAQAEAWSSVARVTRVLLDIDRSNVVRVLEYAKWLDGHYDSVVSYDVYRALGSFSPPGPGEEVFALLHCCLAELQAEVEKNRWHGLYLGAALRARHLVTAYEALPDRDETFARLTRTFVASPHGSGLAHDPALGDLLERRQSDSPEDTVLLLLRAYQLMINGEFAAAERLFARVSEAGVPEHAKRFTGYRVETLYQLGRGFEALEALEPREEVIEVLLDIAMWRPDAPLLRRLAEVQLRDLSDDPAPGLWLAHADFVDGRYEECLRRLAEGEASGDAWWDDEWLYMEDRCRSLLRLGRLDEALAVAISLDEDDFAGPCLIVARGVRGEHEEAVKLLEEYLWHGSETIWEDPDLGPIFAEAPQYAALRAEYPRGTVPG